MPTTTRAAIDFTHGQPLAIEEIVLPDPGPSEVRVRLFASGICHSQLHQIHNPDSSRPLLLGHEATGVVEAAGREVTHVREGDRVMVTWVPRDVTEEMGRFSRSRAIVRGQELNGGQTYTWAEHVLCHEQMVLPLGSDVPTDVTAIIGCAVVTGVGAVLGTAGVQAGQTMAVFGVGGVGINILAGGRIAGAGRIIAVDLLDEKLEFAKKFGATDVVNASKTDPVEAIRELTGGGVDFAFDGIGMESVINQCIESTRPGILGLRRGGTAVSVGIPQGGVTLKPRLFPMAERTLIGSLGGSSHPVEDFPQYLKWYREGLLPLEEMVTKRYDGLDAINEGVHALERGEITGRSIMIYERP
jgi:Zn-dependent alcohol dehydrogenase